VIGAVTLLLNFLESLLPDWAVQYGEWQDSNDARKRYAVLKPAGGVGGDLMRRPQFTLSLIGLEGGDMEASTAAADKVVQSMRDSAGGLVFLQPGEPVFMTTDNRRPVFEIAVSAITT
jgi:hypothetical protein